MENISIRGEKEIKNFFDTKSGLTSTSANHICNLAKEMRKSIELRLENIQFYNTSLSLIGQPDTIVSTGYNQIGQIKADIENIGALNSLIAFLREAIQEKENLQNWAKSWTDTAKREAIKLKEETLRNNKPAGLTSITKEEALLDFSTGEIERYYTLEAMASAFGKYIHEDGPLANAREAAQFKANNPVEVKANGRDTLIYKYQITTDLSIIDSLYFELQQEHRNIQAELNGMKKRIQDTIEQSKLEVDEIYREAYNQWHRDMSALDREKQILEEEEKAKRMELLKEVQELKIVIPKRLQAIYDSVTRV